MVADRLTRFQFDNQNLLVMHVWPSIGDNPNISTFTVAREVRSRASAKTECVDVENELKHNAFICCQTSPVASFLRLSKVCSC